MQVRFGVLGGVEAWVDGTRADLGHARQRCVLAVLLLEVNQVVSVDRLIERVWGGRPPTSVRNTLYGYLYRLRRLVPVDIERRSGGYALMADPMSVDVHRFTALVAQARAASDDDVALGLFDTALALWRGDPFADLEAPFVSEVRAALDRQRLAAELDRNDCALESGRHADLLVTLPDLAEAHPLDERLAGQLMLALHRSGRQAEALEHYLCVHRRLTDELGAEPSTALRRVHQEVLGAGESAGPLPRQLPAAPWSFTGRADAMAELDKATSDSVVVTGIVGAGGIGKTWLALNWAHRRLDRFPDGQLHVDLRGFDPAAKPTPPAQALRSLLGALGAQPDPGDDVDALAARYRSVMAGKRMLVLLDNAFDAGQVIPLLPGTSTSVVLVTSRHMLSELVTRHGAKLVGLDAMKPAEATELLVRHLGAERVVAAPDAVAAILSHCVGLPLALSIAAARAAAYPDFPLTMVASELRDDRLDSLRAVFAASYHVLDAEAARVFRLIGAAPGPDISVRAACALTGLPLPRLRTALRRLETAHLIQRYEATRYRMHDLVRLYAAEQETDLKAVRALVDFYVETAHSADRGLSHQSTWVSAPGKSEPLEFTDAEEAMTWLVAEHPGLVAAQLWAAQHEEHEAVWHLAWALDTFYWRRGMVDLHLASWRAGIASAHHLDDATLAQGHRSLSHALMRVGDQAGAQEHLLAALEVYSRMGASLEQGHVNHDIAAVMHRNGNTVDAIASVERALDFYRRAEAKLWEANALNSLGWFLADVGDHERGRVHCARAVALCRALGYREGEAAARDSLGHIAHETGAQHRALAHYRHTVRLRRELGDAYEEADALVWLGKVHAALGQITEARAVWHEALALYRDQGRQAQLAEVRALL
jgi:DNA-binding SARP family transcriptional activator